MTKLTVDDCDMRVLAVGETHDVLGLDVSVNDAVAVHVGESRHQPVKDIRCADSFFQTAKKIAVPGHRGENDDGVSCSNVGRECGKLRRHRVEIDAEEETNVGMWWD